jgi:hypothetical protein
MRILKSVSYTLALACVVILFIPCTASAQDTGPDPCHSSNLTDPDPCHSSNLTRSTQEWNFVQSGLPIFEATQDNTPAGTYLPARVQASELPAKLGDRREMNAVIGKSWKLVHGHQS